MHDVEKSPAWFECNMQLHDGIAIPHHMVQPGMDGYRTPPGEDDASLPSPLPLSATDSHFGLQRGLEQPDERLSWKQRMKHFTWTFFALTMATGGIANILASGRYTSRFPDRTSDGQW